MNTATFFILLSVICLVQSNSVGRSYEDRHPVDNLVDSDLSNGKTARILNESPSELELPESKFASLTNNPALTTFFLPLIGLLFKFLLSSKLKIVHLLFGIIFGIISTLVACNSTPFCNITAGPRMMVVEPLLEYLSPGTVDMMLGYVRRAMDMYETVQKLN